ncbi:tetratricopeptide repeat protein [Hyalangium gracile]|uniref:tetratricopeptide repeat protein n=1 Tax=Hyalangium gracile TaxID=394092 RepID=UPI001CCDFB0C|nr:tetratricopeptide repeat protein [Hyalangium gracile]
MPPSLSPAVRTSYPRPSSRRSLWLGALMTGLLLLGTPALAAQPSKKKPAATKKKEKAATAQTDKQSKALYEDAAGLVRAKQYSEAQTLARRCLDTDPKNPDCHMILGAALAGTSNFSEAAKEYRTFLELAPDHRLAPKVRQTLENYEKTLTPAQ